MARFDQIKDAKLRGQAEAAHLLLRSGKATEAVRTLSDAFIELLADHPELKEITTEIRGRSFPLVARWPTLGANLVFSPAAADPPRVEFVRERFAISEALTYYEFLVDLAVGRGL